MTQPDDLANRVVSLEQQVAMIRQQLPQAAADAAAAQVLAAGADRDVSVVRAELRAHTGVLNALREDHLSLRGEMGDMRAEIDELRLETRQGFTTVNEGMARIVTLIQGIAGAGH